MISVPCVHLDVLVIRPAFQPWDPSSLDWMWLVTVGCDATLSSNRFDGWKRLIPDLGKHDLASKSL